MHYKQNNKESKTYVQGLRSFGNTLPRGVKGILKKRGYNQSYFIAEGISDAIQIKIDLELITKEIHTESQTKKSRFKRWQNVDSSFKLNMERIPEYRGKHILLVDDVLTTGSTLEACGSQLLQIPGVKLSLLTMAVAEG